MHELPGAGPHHAVAAQAAPAGHGRGQPGQAARGRVAVRAGNLAPSGPLAFPDGGVSQSNRLVLAVPWKRGTGTCDLRKQDDCSSNLLENFSALANRPQGVQHLDS